ncbi:MAG: site-specific DNA-methyltransferase [Victivallaceae bacterium]|nr:site-specific DNA-methyltransferase [Victivallaceae bacterium]
MNKFSELIAKLREILQIDRPDLDFGIYRIINARAAEIEKFLTDILPKKVRQSLVAGSENDTAALQSALDKAVTNARELGADPESLPKVKELRQRIAEATAGTIDYESRVYAHLLQFFSRYYDKGDFISKRRYKGDTYAIPYDGEEVKLYWANFDQYYTKSGENFSNYTLKLGEDKRVHFRLVSADTAKDNRKDNDLERCFVLFQPRDTETQSSEALGEEEINLLPDDFIEVNGDDFTIYFEYKQMPKGTKQAELIREAIKSITEKLNSIIVSASASLRLCVNELLTACPTPKNPERTRLEKELTNYVSKNSADYFIHKDLGKFLNRELDFYIKNEMMNLDDIQHIKTFREIEKNLKMIQCMRLIASELIIFMAQLENFQKKLWLKKKFVVETNYCITLDRVPETLREEIFENKAQVAEWEKLGLFNTETQRHGDELDLFNNSSAPPCLRVENNFLMVDTKFFNAEFKAKLLSAIPNIDEQCDGLLIHSENFQALNLLQERYREQIKCIYIDPPYNTGDGDFPYKDCFKTASWLSMFLDRLNLSKNFMNRLGLFACHMDEHEHLSLEILIKRVFGDEGDLGKLIWDKKNPKGDATGIAVQHEYVHFAASTPVHLKEDSNAFVREKPNALPMLEKAERLIKKAKSVTEGVRTEFQKWVRKSDFSNGEKAYSFIDNNGNVYRTVSMAWPNKKKAPDEYFIPLVHPITKKACPIPARGWRNPPDTMKILLDKGDIVFGKDEKTQPTRKYLLKENITENVPSLYYMGGSDDKLFKNFGINFDNPKPVIVGEYFIAAMTRNSVAPTIMDFFAGSGTIGHAVINLNRVDAGKRKYILIEMGEHFNSLLKPRIEKVVYSPDWKDGKPTTFDKGISHCFKYLRLESYEDTLNNLELKRDKIQDDLLAEMPELLRSEYLLKYILDIESRGSILSTNAFKKPFGYTLDIAADSAGATKRQSIDLVETFNYLIGLRLKTYSYRPERGIAIIEGTLPDGENALILWRDCEIVGYEELNKYCESLNINPKSSHYDVVYVNGDHGIANQTQAMESEGGITKQMKLRQIEEEFLTRMFEEN